MMEYSFPQVLAHSQRCSDWKLKLSTVYLGYIIFSLHITYQDLNICLGMHGYNYNVSVHKQLCFCLKFSFTTTSAKCAEILGKRYLAVIVWIFTTQYPKNIKRSFRPSSSNAEWGLNAAFSGSWVFFGKKRKINLKNLFHYSFT